MGKSWNHFELTHEFEHLIAIGDLVLRQIPQAFETEFFHIEAREDASVNDRLAQVAESNFSFDVAGQITGQTAGECIPRPGRIVDVFQRIRAATEEFVFAEKQRTVFAFFDRDERGPFFRMRRPALIKLVSPVIWRASLSFKMSKSTRGRSASRSGRVVSIHKSIVSATTKRGRFI